jgi:hypothetical protein
MTLRVVNKITQLNNTGILHTEGVLVNLTSSVLPYIHACLGFPRALFPTDLVSKIVYVLRIINIYTSNISHHSPILNLH